MADGDNSQRNPFVVLIGLIVFGVALFYVYGWPRLIEWWSQNGSIVITILAILMVISAVLISGWWIYKSRKTKIKRDKENQERLRKEEEYRKKIEEYEKKGWRSLEKILGILKL